MDLKPSEEVTQQWLDKELSSAQELLERRAKKLEADPVSDDDSDGDKHGSLMDRLWELNDTADAIALSQEVTQWAADADNAAAASEGERVNAIFRDAHDCVALAKILCRHECQSSLHKNLYEREYQPLHAYVRTNLMLQLRHILMQSGYPSAEGCGDLMEESGIPTSPLTQCCEWLTKLQAATYQVANHSHNIVVSASASPWSSGESCDVLVEFFRPIVERVRFHFVEYNNERATSSKIDRLPEWLLTYLVEHVLEGKRFSRKTSSANNNQNNSNSSSPWELLTLGLAAYVTEDMPILFLNELVGVVQWVLGSERNFFRHEKIAGPKSNPMLLCNAIEQLLEFDDTLRSLLPMGQADRLLRLMDIFIAGDEELLSWWLSREKEMVFATLFDKDGDSQADANQGSKLKAVVKTRISLQAELFCALIRSVQVKASVFSFSGPYLNAVAVPLSMQFLDAVHESATDLRKFLADTSVILHASSLTKNLEDWMAVINGTHLAAAILTRENPWAQQSMAPSASSSVNDLARFGRSLEQLQNVLVEEFATTFVESFLMGRMKLAGYLMRCSHFLSHAIEDEEDDDDDDGYGDVSFDLRPTMTAVSKFLELCNEDDSEEIEDVGHSFATQFAPRVMSAKVLPMLADKFMEVALDLHGLVPEILPEGASVFARDVTALFGIAAAGAENRSTNPLQNSANTIVLRLLDVVKFMNMSSKSLEALQLALLGLVGGPRDQERPWFIFAYQFTADATLYEEAVCMLRAKGFVSLELEDAISILNRRRDLMHRSEVKRVYHAQGREETLL
jgi:hypothetical protein